MHDYRRGFVGLFPDGLHHLPRERGRKIVGIHGVDRCNLFSDTGIACSARFRDPPSGDYHPHSGFSPQMGSPPKNRTLDDPNLALRISHRRARVLDALQMVSSRDLTSNLALKR